jgi:hypothetical protein
MPRGINISKSVTDQELMDWYWKQQMTMTEIARRIGFSSSSGIYNVFRTRNLPRRTYCEAIELRRAKHPDSFGAKPIGELAYNWRGGRIHTNGYIKILKPDHPTSTATGHILEHRYIWETTHNKLLPPNFVVHHLNGVRDDNRPENLVALPRNSHQHGIDANREYIKELQKRIRELEQLRLPM